MEARISPRKTLPKHIFEDGAKWLLVPSKIALDGMSLWPERQNGLTGFLNVLCLTSSVLIVVGNCFYLKHEEVDLASVAFTLSLLILNIETPTRIILARFYKDKLARILSKIYFEFWPSDITGKSLHASLNRSSRYLFAYCVIYAFVGFTCDVQFIMMSYFNRRTPLGTAYPFDWRKSPFYEISHIWQSFYLVGMLVIVCGMDLFLVSLLFNCVAQFKILRVYLRQNFERIVHSSGDYKTETRKLVVSCIEHHIKLMGVCSEIDEVFTYYILTQYLLNLGTICLSSFVATVLPGELGTAFTYLTVNMSEIFIYCYMGNELTIESLGFSQSIFECGWHLGDVDKDLQKSLIVMMMRAQRPLKISTGGFGYLSLAGFMGLLRFSFSVYTLLDSLMQKQDAS